MNKTYKPGETAQHSGLYTMVGPRGGRTTVERTVVKGEPLPPTLKPKQRYVLTEPANNGAGRKTK